MQELGSDQVVDEEIETVLRPYRKLLLDQEKLQRLRAEKHLHQRVTDLNQLESFKATIREIEKKTSTRLEAINSSANAIKLTPQEPIGIDCLPVPYDLQTQMIASMEGMVNFSNNFHRALKILNDTPAAGGVDICTPLERTVAQFNGAISNAKLALENTTELRDGVDRLLLNEENRNQENSSSAC